MQSTLCYKVNMRIPDNNMHGGDRMPGHRSDSTVPEGEEPLDPAAMLKLMRVQQRSVTSRMGSFVSVITATWGIAWLTGFLLLWLIDGGKPTFALPLPVAAGGFAALIGIAIAISIVLGVRNTRGVRTSPTSAFTGAVYGYTWSVSMIALYIFGVGLIANGMPPSLAQHLLPLSIRADGPESSS